MISLWFRVFSLFVLPAAFPTKQVFVDATFVLHPNSRRPARPSSVATQPETSPLSSSSTITTTIRWTSWPSIAASMALRDPTTLMYSDHKQEVRLADTGTSSRCRLLMSVTASFQNGIHILGRRNISPPFPTALRSSNGKSDHDDGADYFAMIAETSTTSPIMTKGMDRVAVVQTGLGCCHGRNVTKAAIRAIRNAIDYNSVKIRTIIPGGYDNLKIHLQMGIPSSVYVLDDSDHESPRDETRMALNIEAILKEFPYGTVTMPLDIQSGGLLASNGVQIAGTGIAKEDMTLVVACVSIGYDDLPTETV